MNKKIDSARHIYLYAKGHYEQSDNLMQDMRVLVGHHAAIPSRYVEESDIFITLCEIATPHLIKGGEKDTEYRLQELFKNFIRISQCKQRPLNVENIVEGLLSVLRCVNVKDEDGNIIINLGEPDYKILPKPQQ